MAVKLFDSRYYAAVNPDLAPAGIQSDKELEQHFKKFGLKEGRLFSPLINLDFYRLINPDLAAAGLTSNKDLFNHLENFGVAEGRRFSEFVELNFYQKSNPQLSVLNLNTNEQLFQHLQTQGLAQGLRFSSLTDLGFYLNGNADLKQAFGNDLTQAFAHLQTFGIAENRSFIPGLNLDTYLAANPDVNQAVQGSREGALEHLVAFGIAEKRSGIPQSLDSYSVQVEVVDQLLESLVKGDKQAFLNLQTFDVSWQVAGNQAPLSPNTLTTKNIIPFAENWYGVFGISRTVGDFFDAKKNSVQLQEFKPLDFFQDGDLVVARVYEKATVNATGLSYGVDTTYVVDLADSGSDRNKIESVEVIYNSYPVAKAFVGQPPSAAAANFAAVDPLTGMSLSENPNASSEESQQQTLNAYATFGRGDFNGFLQTFSPDVDFSFPGDPAVLPYSGYFKGREGVADVFTKIGQTADQSVFNTIHTIANGDRVVVINQEELTAKNTGISWQFPTVNYLTIGSDGLIKNFEGVFDTFISSSAISPVAASQTFFA